MCVSEYEYSEQEYEDEEEEEEDEKHVMETLEDLKAKYQQMTPEDSDVEPAEEDFETKVSAENFDHCSCNNK